MIDKTAIIEKVKQNPYYFKELSEELRSDEAIINATLIRDMKAYIADDLSFTMFAVFELFDHIPTSKKKEVAFCKDLIKSASGFIFPYFHESIRNNKEVFLLALKHARYDYILQKLSEQYQNEKLPEDIEQNLAFFIEENTIINFTGNTILNDKATALEALDYEPSIFYILPIGLQKDPDIYKKALEIENLKVNESATNYATEKSNIINKLKENPAKIKEVPKEFLQDPEVIKAAIVRKWSEYLCCYINDYDGEYEFFKPLQYFKYAHPKLKYNKEFILELIPVCSGFLYEFLPESIRNDKDVLILAVQYAVADKIIAELANEVENSDEFEENSLDEMDFREFDLKWDIYCRGSITTFTNKDLLNDRDVVLQILEANDDSSFENFSDKMKEDYEIAEKAIALHPQNFFNVKGKLAYNSDLAKLSLDPYSNNQNFVYEYYVEGFIENMHPKLKKNKKFLEWLEENDDEGLFEDFLDNES
jgi:hypothetical protein